ncbi:MAG: hypothetical protein EOM19_02155 [Candidatus Moranbacteria bacterium]|nr:hypothetical protein [Candidatus Moranbacteria bacterium]
MKEQHAIKFDETNHSYTVDGQEAISVTQLLKAIGIGKTFDENNRALMEKVRAASEKGNYYDALAEEAINDPFELTEWQERFIDTIRKAGLNLQQAQPRFGTLKPFPIAGTGDFKGRNVKTGAKVIVDLKATYEIYVNSVKWQTNIYAWLDDPEFFEQYEKYVVHYNEKDDRFTVLQLENVKKESIDKALQCYMLDEKYTEGTEITEIVNMKVLSQTFSKVQEYKKLLDEEQEKLNKFYKTIEDYMAESSIKTLELEDFKITYTEPGIRRSVNYTKAAEDRNIERLKAVNTFLAEHGQEEYHLITVDEVKENITNKEKEEYTTVTNVKGRLTVTPLKKEK